MSDLNGKVAMVTGAARRVGRGIALELAAAGADIVLHYHGSDADAQRTGDEIRNLGRTVELLRADLSEPQQIADLFVAVKRAFGRLDVLVNSAAVFDATPLDDFAVDVWDRQFIVNVRAVALCIRYAARIMPPGSAIVNLGDTTAQGGRATFAAYCAAKAAVLSLTCSAAKALAPNITVNAVSPGIAEWPKDSTPERQQAVLAHVPLHRPGSPYDMAQAILFLATSPYITAQNLRVDGGWHMG